MKLDPRTHAVRSDLADIRLAGRVFAPHFAAAISSRARRTASLMTTPSGTAEIARLSPGDVFDVLEIAAIMAWGVAIGAGLVGYIDRDALEIGG